MRKIYNKRLFCIMLISMMMLLSACSSIDEEAGKGIDELLIEGAETFEGDREETFISETNIDDELQAMIELYGNGYTPPEIIHLPDKPEPQPSDAPTENTVVEISSRQDFLKLMAKTIDDANDQEVRCVLENGYVIDDNEISEVLELNNTTAWMNDGYVESVTYSLNGNQLSFWMYYTIATSEIKEKEKLAREKAAKIEKSLGLANMSDSKKVAAVNEYLCDHVIYPTNIDDRYDHSPWRPLCKGIGVCDGYARSANLLLSDVGMDIQVVVGTTSGGGHAWNLVKVDGKWYQMDICWNATGSSRTEYLLVDDAFMSMSRVWNPDNYPKAQSGKYKFKTK